MLPIGPLMMEHRLIERMIAAIRGEVARIRENPVFDASMITIGVDFIRMYANRIHHGKEENILFRELAKKDISEEHRAMMDELIAEHVWARQRVAELVAAVDLAQRDGHDVRDEVVKVLEQIVAFYPKHIKKEDKEFFIPVMDYFSAEEKDAMLSEYRKFDRKMIHKMYSKVVEACEANVY